MRELWVRNHHFYEAMLWLVLIVPTVLWFRDSVLWVAFLSIYANYKTAISAHEGRRARLEAAATPDPEEEPECTSSQM